MGLRGFEFWSERPDLGSKRPDLRSEGLVLGSERPEFGSEGLEFRSERSDLRSEWKTGEYRPVWPCGIIGHLPQCG